ncbi:hypothetical protein [Actinomyces culturomici]|uniref:hypothetical protein n=1 Tax=Actinomyces culturomici TaxID=1926276 RepID=UPI000E209D27|nr:hypothetical protein [Actinomyces culturomici]
MSAHRQAEYVVRLLDEDDREIRVLDGVTGGSVSLSASTRLRASGSLSIRETGEPIDWLSQRVRIDYEPVGVEGWPLGVFLLSTPQDAYSDSGRAWDVELLGKLAILDGTAVEATTSVEAGENLVGAAKQFAVEAGWDRIAVTPSQTVAASQIVWEAGTSLLTIINDLLSAAGYWAAFVDGYGVLQLQPYTRPASRAQAFAFVEGEESIHSAEWTRDQDLASVPNRVVLVGQGSGDTPALVGVATNEDPESPYSVQRRGRWISLSETGVEAADQATIDALAHRRLIDASTPQATLQISHMPIPIVPNDAGVFRSQGVDARVVVKSVEYQLDPTALAKTKLLEVIDL